MMFVTLEDAKSNLRVDTSYEDADLTRKVKAASRACWRYIKDGVDGGWLDSAGQPIEDTAGYVVDVPDDIREAVLLLVGDFFKERDGANTAEWEHGFLPVSVRTMLYPYRMPTLA